MMSGENAIPAQGGFMSPAAKTHGPYSLHPGVAQVQKWVQDLPHKTGRLLEEWIALTRKSGPPTRKERCEWLKKEHKLGANAAARIGGTPAAKGNEEDSPEAYLKAAAEWVEAQYQAPGALRPSEQLLKPFSLGTDVKACPCKIRMVPYRNHVFAQIGLSTNTRIDLGFALGNMKTPKA